VGIGITILASSTPAMAEGYFGSYLSGVAKGYESRRWTDLNRDSSSTDIRLRNCAIPGNLPNPWADVAVYRAIDFQPDQNKGTKNFSCSSSATGRWGDLQSGTYYFAVKNFNSYAFWADPVEVWW
jgi:hypothetical protein